MQRLSIVLLFLMATTCSFAQFPEGERLKLSLQTDLLAYTTPGGWSAWVSGQVKPYKLSLAFVNYPNRFRDIYEETGIQENPRWLRIQLSQEFKPTSKLRHFLIGLNAEHHWPQH